MEVGLRLDDFWAMTPAEFGRAVEAYNNKTKQHQQMLAWVQANLMTMWAKKGRRVKISDLIKTDEEDRPTFHPGGGPMERARFNEHMRQLAVKDEVG